VKLSIVPILAVTALFGGLEAHASALINGDFETGDFTGWTVTGGPQPWAVPVIDSYYPQSLSFDAMFQVSVFSSISQTVDTDPGATYFLSFWVGTNGFGSSDYLQVLWNGSVVQTIDTSVPNTGSNQYQPYQLYTHWFVADSPTSTLGFNGANTLGFTHLDNITLVDPVSAPEPFTWTFTLVGIAACGLVRRLRRS
jgi:hypothetical protein